MSHLTAIKYKQNLSQKKSSKRLLTLKSIPYDDCSCNNHVFHYFVHSTIEGLPVKGNKGIGSCTYTVPSFIYAEFCNLNMVKSI